MEVTPHKHRLKRGEKVLSPGEKPVIWASKKSVPVPKTKSDTKRVTISIDDGHWVILRDYNFCEKKVWKTFILTGPATWHDVIRTQI